MAGICDDCDSSSVIAPFPVFVTGINTSLKVQQGGITGIAVLKCSEALADETVKANWDAAITALDMVVLRDCLIEGGLDETPATETLGACLVDIVSDFTSTLTIKDIQDNATFDRSQFWADVRTRPLDFLVAYWTCQNVNGGAGGNTIIHGFFRASIIATYKIDTTKAGKAYWEAVITWHNPIDDVPLDAQQVLAFNINALVTP
jgi:hypothetical protein